MQPTDNPLPAALSRLVADLQDVFARGWLAGAPPDLERLVASVPADARPELFRRLLSLELDHRRQQGRPLSADEASLRFAGLGDWVEPILAALGLDLPHPLTLRVTAGPHAGQTFHLRGHNTFLVGRGDRVHLALPGDLLLSRLHLVIECNPPHARVVDSGSKHGTFVNGRRVEQADLTDGDEVGAGQTTLRVAIGLPPGEDLDSPPLTHSVAGTPPPAQPPGVWPCVPGFAVKEKRGEGGMGVVYRAQREADGRIVALKTVQPAVSPRPSLVARFQREVRILERLEHPHIVRFLGAGEAGGLLYFAMEYVEGPGADEVVRRSGPLPLERVVRLGCQLLDALAFAHERGFVHRDVKPGNLLLAAEAGGERLKLADFGLARAYEQSALSGLTVSGTSGGTAAFMPPEQVTDFRNVQPAADQYGAAATLYYLLTGEHVYERSRSSVELMRRILGSEPIPLRGTNEGPALPPGLGGVLRRALAREPQRRYPDVRAMREELGMAGEGST